MKKDYIMKVKCTDTKTNMELLIEVEGDSEEELSRELANMMREYDVTEMIIAKETAPNVYTIINQFGEKAFGLLY